MSDRNDPIRGVDFSSGVRGKYVDRYREGASIREAATSDPIEFYETQSRLGNALWHAQAFEACFVVYLSLVRDLAVSEASARAHDILEHDGTQLSEYSTFSRVQDAADLEDRLERFLQERNWLVHYSSFDLQEETEEPAEKRELTLRLEGLADEANYLTEVLLESIQRELSARGLTVDEIERRTRATIREWTKSQ